MGGIGHSPLIPMVALSNAPSGFVVNHAISKLYVTVAAFERPRRAADQATGIVKRLKPENIVKMTPLAGDTRE